jgi:hypothetical protein
MDLAADQGHPVDLVGNGNEKGECVALTSQLTGVTADTSQWRAGPKVVNADGTLNSAVKPGTAIATFDSNGRYPGPNVKDKNSATFLGPGVYSGNGGIRVMDQWKAHPPNSAHAPQSRDVSNNSNSYFVIIVPRN